MTRAVGGHHRTIWLLSKLVTDWGVGVEGLGGGEGVDRGGHLAVHAAIHNTGFCYVVKFYLLYAW